MTAALPMGGQKITGMADPTVATDGATKNYVDTTTAAFFSTGDGKISLKTTADTGWILCDDGTFGSGSSGSSNRANVDTLALFTLFFNNISDVAAPVLTSGGGATTRAAQVSASAAWAANCRMTLTKQLGRSIAVAGTGSGLTARPLGSNVGEENHTLTVSELPTNIQSTGTFHPAGDPTKNVPVLTGPNWGFQTVPNSPPSVTVPFQNGGAASQTADFSGTATSSNTGGGGHNTMQPTGFWNVMIKL